MTILLSSFHPVQQHKQYSSAIIIMLLGVVNFEKYLITIEGKLCARAAGRRGEKSRNHRKQGEKIILKQE